MMMNHNQASILKIQDVAHVLQTDLSNGLTTFEARERLKKYGHNRLSDTTTKTVPKLICHRILNYFMQFMNPLIQLLLICVIISVSIGEYENAVSVLIAVFIVCTISYVQEYRADKSLEKLNKQVPSVCRAIRQGQITELHSDDLVPGDVVYLEEGQRVPADVRLFELKSLTINEANLTGETQSQSKIEEANNEKLSSALKGQTSLDRDKNFIFKNLGMMGTQIESGSSKGLVICTGKSTRYGQVFSILKNTIQPKSPLQLNIDQLSIHLVIIAITVITITSMIGIIQQRPPMEVAYYAISLAVTAIPEGLPVVVAVMMALGVLRLSKLKTILKSMNSIETLGCFQILCADKTGTLTRHDMTLTDIVTSELHSLSTNELDELNNEEFKRQMTFNKFGGKLYSIGRLMEVGTLCNDASVDPNPSDGSGLKLIGQATECAILDAALRMGFGDSRTKFDRISEEPFDPTKRRMVVKCQRRDLAGGSPMYYVKGAWEEVLSDCTYYNESGLVKQRTDEMWSEYARICMALGKQGLRVLAMASGSELDQLTFVGIVGIANSPRAGISDTIKKLRDDFHIDVKMITGDSKSTAISIGRAIGLIEDTDSDEYSSAISGEEVEKILDSEMNDETKGQEILFRTIFYRVDPVQKATVIRALQDLDKVVAMTGDGVNDIISLKRANISIAMGSGADVCKEVADIIAVDNDLSVLIPAVIEGKGIYLRVQSFLSYQISISLTLLILTAISFAARFEPPFTVTQLLFINLLADGPPAQALGFEKPSEKELKVAPRDVHDPLLNCRLLSTIICLTLTLTSLNGILYIVLVSRKLR